MEELKINDNYPQNSNYGLLAVSLILISTIIQAFFGYTREANEWAKALIAICCWGAVVYSLGNIKNIQRFSKTGLVLICSMGVLVMWSIINVILFGEVIDGNKYLVTFGNMYGALNLTGIAFLFALNSLHDVRRLRKAACIMVIVSIILVIFRFKESIDSYFLTYICAFAPLFIFYSKKISQATLLLGLVLSLLCFYGGGRQAAFFFVFAFSALIGAKILSKQWVFYISMLIMLLPFLFMYISLRYGSIFDIALTSLDLSSAPQTMNDEELTADNRTFLWLEFLFDFQNHSQSIQWFGQGAVAYYESSFFKTIHRMGIEVPILQLTMQAGLSYVILFSIFVFYTIFRLYKYGENKICKIASILIAAFYFDSYICNTNGCSIMQFGVWFMFSIAFNEELLTFDDESLKKILSQDVSYTYDHSTDLEERNALNYEE